MGIIFMDYILASLGFIVLVGFLIFLILILKGKIKIKKKSLKEKKKEKADEDYSEHWFPLRKIVMTLVSLALVSFVVVTILRTLNNAPSLVTNSSVSFTDNATTAAIQNVTGTVTNLLPDTGSLFTIFFFVLTAWVIWRFFHRHSWL
jgi:quinol-cytochrome oxidoreductase complex cytochrome b subunit